MSGSSTRDWLLDKLMKLRQAMSEMKADYENKLDTLETLKREQVRILVEARDLALKDRDNCRESYVAMRERVAELAPEKQFEIIRRHKFCASERMLIQSVSSANGRTTIVVVGEGVGP